MEDIPNIPSNTQEEDDYAMAVALAASLNDESDEAALVAQIQMQEYEDQEYLNSKVSQENTFPTSDEGLIELVCSEMATYEGWFEVDKEQVIIKDCSGHGGSKTYFIQAPESCIPSKVCLHVRKDDPHLLPRMIAGAKAFEGQNLGPRQLACGGNFWIDESVGQGTAKFTTPELWKKCGQLLACIHMIPTDWWDAYKDQYIEEEPVALAFPPGSLAWIYLQRDAWQSDLPAMGEEAKFEYATAVTTDHPIGGRIVTTHGDFHPGNIIDLGEEFDNEGSYRFRCVDFEFTCVSHAIQDIAYQSAIAKTKIHKEAFLSGYLEEVLGSPPSEEEVRSLQIEAELYMITTWHSGGMLAPWEIRKKTEEEIMELVAEIKAFCVYVRATEEAQNQIVEKGLAGYITSQDHAFGAYLARRIQKEMAGLFKEADEAAAVFSLRLSWQRALEESKKGTESDTNEEKPATETDLLSRAVWRQPEGAKHPIEIGKARDLGLNSNFTCMAWLKNEKPAVGDWQGDRNSIFHGDIDPPGTGTDWEDHKQNIFHLELRHENRFYFGFGWDDISSKRTCRVGVWDHVAFVYNSDGDKDGKIIVVNGEDAGRRWGEGAKPYGGDETIWLGDGLAHGIGHWVGKIHGAMIFNEALSTDQILEIAAATQPGDETRPEVVEATPEVFEAAPEVVEAAPEVVEAAPEVVEAAPEVAEAAPEVVEADPENDETHPEVDDN